MDKDGTKIWGTPLKLAARFNCCIFLYFIFTLAVIIGYKLFLAAGLILIKTSVMLQQVTLVFPSLHHLWGFVREAKINYEEIVSDSFTLVCQCPDKDLHLAKEKYAAMPVMDSRLQQPVS